MTHTKAGSRRFTRGAAATLLAISVLVPSFGAAAVADDGATLDVGVTDGLDPDGQDVTVTGEGFDPEGNLGARPPLQGQPGGVYVAFARVDDPWQPSAGAPGSARSAIEDHWALPEPSYSILSDMDGIILMDEDGAFETTLHVAVDEDSETDLPDGEYAIIAYPGSGATNADEEILIPLSFATDDEGQDDGDDNDTVAGDITDGGLDWGVHDNFVSYVRGPIAGGEIITADGANEFADGIFQWVDATGEFDEDDFTAGFAGTVQFTGHELAGEALLDLTLSSPTVDIDGNEGALLVDVRSRGLDDPDTVFEEEQVHFADLDLDAATTSTDNDIVTVEDITVTLTDDGSEAFANFYEPGDQLDPISLTFTVEANEEDEDDSDGDNGDNGAETAQLHVDVTDGLDPDGQDVTVTGEGFDPEGNLGARPPLQGQPGGVYVAFARVDDPWQPSAGAPGSARSAIEDHWALPEPSYSILSDMDGIILMDEDGAFETTLHVAVDEDSETDLPDGEYAIIAYPGSGATNADEEILIPLSFATDDEGQDDGDGNDGDNNGGNDDDNGNDDDGNDDGNENNGVVAGAITDGTLDWGVQESFRNYIQGSIANGEAVTSDGAQENPDGTYRFVDATGEFDEDDFTAGFAGTVQFTGHELAGEALLDLTLSSPTVDIDGNGGALLVDVRSRGLDDPDTVFEEEQVHFADLDLDAATTSTDNDIVTVEDITVTLTEDGSEAFANFYEPGDQLDPVSLTFAVDGADFDVPAPPSGDSSDGSGDGSTPPGVDAPAFGAPDSGNFGAGLPTAAGSLPRTGADTAVLLVLALVTIAAGGLALATTRRRASRR